MQLLTERCISLELVDSITLCAVKPRPKGRGFTAHKVMSWCIPAIDHEYACRMEEVFNLYEELLDEKRPVVCFDESPVQLIDDNPKTIS